VGRETHEDWRIDYFAGVVHDVLDEYLRRYGFTYKGVHQGVSVYWTLGDLFFRVGYLAETAPDYELTMGTGLRSSSPLRPASSADSVGVWRLVPSGADPRLVEWVFDSPEGLREVLQHVRDHVVEPYVASLWKDRDRLRSLIAQHGREAEDERNRLLDERRIERARAEFDAGRYADAAHSYAEVDPNRLTRADQKRLELARRRA
jgi:hypothetical protein